MLQTTHSVIMVPPTDFAFNEQTEEDNEFQHPSNLILSELRDEVLSEFNEMVNLLRDQHIEVLILNKQQHDPEMPDAVFPNNWFSTDTRGVVTIYPMKTENRQVEVRPDVLKKLLRANHYLVNSLMTIEADEKALEGTGSIIFDHNSRVAYAAISPRCNADLFQRFCKDYDFKAVCFSTQSRQQKPFYHTNVMLSIGEAFTVICSESIDNLEQRTRVVKLLESSGKEVIDISLEQAERSFCANLLQLKNSQGDFCIVMSTSAYQGFNDSQMSRLKKHGKIIACPISTIESVGGGSARCMMTENFLPKIA